MRRLMVLGSRRYALLTQLDLILTKKHYVINPAAKYIFLISFAVARETRAQICDKLEFRGLAPAFRPAAAHPCAALLTRQ